MLMVITLTPARSFDCARIWESTSTLSHSSTRTSNVTFIALRHRWHLYSR